MNKEQDDQFQKWFALLVSFFVFFSSVFSYSQSATPSQRELYRLNKTAGINFLKRPGVNAQTYLKGSKQQAIFNNVSHNFSFMDYLSLKQKSLLRLSVAAIHAEWDRHPKTAKSLEVTGRSVAASIQTYFMILSTTMFSMAYEQTKMTMTTGEYNHQEFTKNLEKAFDEVVSSGEILSGFISSTLVHASLQIPLKMIQEALFNSTARPIVKIFLVQFSHSLASFTGWEFGSQLWKEATFQLDLQLTDPVERSFLADRNQFWTNLNKAYFQSPPQIDAQKKQAAKKILEQIRINLWTVAMTDTEARLQWLYNTVRLRMMNGHFLTSISIMTATTTIGVTIFPGAGFVWGIVFGLTGGIIATLVPEEQKNVFTTIMKDSLSEIIDTLPGRRSLEDIMAGFTDKGISKYNPHKTLEDILLERISYRERYIDIYIERIFLNNQAIIYNLEKMDQYVQAMRKHPEKTKSILAAIDEHSKIIMERTKSNWSALQRIITLYLTESQLLEFNKPELTDQNLADEYEVQIFNSENLYAHFCSFARSLAHVDPVNGLMVLESQGDRSIQLIKQSCNIKKFDVSNSYKYLSPENRRNYDSMVRFLDKTHWTKFNETKVTLERIHQLTQLGHATQ